MLDSIRFGADKIFRAAKDAEVTTHSLTHSLTHSYLLTHSLTHSQVTDADIDLILEEGKKRTQEMNEKLQAAEKGDLYDFSLDGGMTTQVFEGVDYSTAAAKAAREAEKKELEAIVGMLYSHTHSLTHSLTHSITHSLTHSIIHSVFIRKKSGKFTTKKPPPISCHCSRIDPLQKQPRRWKR